MLDGLVAEARQRWALDLFDGLQVVVAEAIVATPLEPSRPVLIVPAALVDVANRDVVEALPGRHRSDIADPLSVLRRLYPLDHPVGVLGGQESTLALLVSADLDRPLYLAPVSPELAVAGPWAMPFISDRLRRPDGCPWDLEQTHQTLRSHLLEEAYEVFDALEDGATPALAEELGDLLLQVVLHAQLAAEAGVFDLADVQASIATKIVRRHPHVFGDATAATAADVNRQWERIKESERAEEGGEGTPKGALDGISRSLPALAASQEMQERAAAIGYDWPTIEGVLDKITEELAELARAPDAANRREEFGDLLFVAVNVGRKLGIETEAALRAANDKFRSRFGRVERMVGERGVAIRDLDFEALDELWDAAKAEERSR
ncbi:MAG: nucleoside triphosphate pyrophosphohydrolase [Chloroflexota bacterium]